jgi:hypothetical protein
MVVIEFDFVVDAKNIIEHQKVDSCADEKKYNRFFEIDFHKGNYKISEKIERNYLFKYFLYVLHEPALIEIILKCTCTKSFD